MKEKNDYWEQREKEWITSRIKKDQGYLDKMAERYQVLIGDIEKQVNSFYSKYAIDNGLSMSEAIRKVDKFDVKAFEREAKRLVESKDFSANENKQLKIYNATMKINRLEYLKDQVGLELVKVTNKEQKELDEYLNTAYLDEVKRQSGILSKHKSQEVAKKARVVASASFQGATWSDRLWINQTVLKTKLDALISRAMIQGTNPTQLVSMLRKNVAQEVKNATSIIERLVITETARVQDEATMRSFRANGFKFCKWIAEPTACKYCKEMAEKSTEYGIGVYPVMDAPIIPKHPRCRCSKAAYWVDKRLIDKVKKDIKEYRKLVDILGKDSTPESLEIFRNMKYNDVEKYRDLKERIIWRQAKFPTERSFNGHFKSHGKEFGDITRAQYQKLAADLLAESTSENILGYDTDSRRVRYDRNNNIIAIGKKGEGNNVKITTMFKPAEREVYYYDDYEREHVDD
ncbi:minor capsid protein [Ligilactobacillus murinus]|uniref:minor capsid protein n=1 Tax=Ligilactobacillus murinus TaxID=1622 RepID=UPI002DD6B853|nr:minor capsid protein [Ligilactobacillus murinus]WRY38698.1 minor capsid protein [Ligilactobacillus murinus]